MLPFLTADLPGTGGVLRARDEDFFVDEELPYPAAGAGEHVFVRIEKRGLTTRFAAAQIAKALGVQERDIGIAGMKDRHAVTRQWLSLPPPVNPEAVTALAIDGITIVEAVRHGHKLRTGHVRKNRFVLRVRGASAGSVEKARAILTALARAPGAPNWYGEQRFGRDGDNAQKGRELLASGKRGRDKKLDRLFISSLQSELFNQWLVARVEDGLYRTVLAGDVCHKTGGGMFTSDDPATDTTRLVAGELVVTGPMFGDKMRRPTEGSPAAEREAAVLARAGLTVDSFTPVRALAEGTRRDGAIAITDWQVTAGDPGPDGETLEVAFALPGGAYATAVMREVMKTVPQRVDEATDAG